MTDLSRPLRSPLAAAASFLFVPATRPERIAKALASGAHAVIVDLEDAVAPADKPAARAALMAAFATLAPADRARLLVRVNAIGTPWHTDDVAACAALAGQGLGAVMPPKAESSAALAALAAALGPAASLLPLIESVAGLDALDAIARAPQVLRLAFGHLDFQADAGLACDATEAELVPVRLAVVLASRRASLAAPVDGVTVDTQDATRLQDDASRALRGGFGGKLCIHPAQVAGVNAAFTPTPDELARAHRVLAAAEVAGGGVCTVDGRMVDAPVIALARRTLARAGVR